MWRIVVGKWVVVNATVECAVIVGPFRTQVVHLFFFVCINIYNKCSIVHNVKFAVIVCRTDDDSTFMYAYDDSTLCTPYFLKKCHHRMSLPHIRCTPCVCKTSSKVRTSGKVAVAGALTPELSTLQPTNLVCPFRTQAGLLVYASMSTTSV